MKRVACFALVILALALGADAQSAKAAAAVPRGIEGPVLSEVEGRPTFTKDVAPILYNSCVSCHRAGEVAPMSLVSYEDVRPWAKSIRLKVANREMPPWGADPRFGTFKDDRSLTAVQIDTIAKWVDGGAPKGSDADLPPVPTFATGWSRGEPDVVIEMPIDFDIPAEGLVPVIDFFAKSPFTEDVYVKALEVRPGTPGVVHHAGLYVIERLPDGAKLVNGRIVDADGKPMGRNQVARANGGTSTEEIQKLQAGQVVAERRRQRLKHRGRKHAPHPQRRHQDQCDAAARVQPRADEPRQRLDVAARYYPTKVEQPEAAAEGPPKGGPHVLICVGLGREFRVVRGVRLSVRTG